MNAWSTTIDTPTDAPVEMWPFGTQNIIAWTEDFKYKVYTQSGTVLWQGQLDQTLPEKTLPLLQTSCIWFTPMEGNKMLYVALNGDVASLRVWDFETLTGTDFATGLAVKREKFHNFCWLHYNKTTKKVQLAWQGPEKSHYVVVSEGATSGNIVDFDLMNACIFSVWQNSLWLANNFGDTKVLKIHGLHADGTVTNTTMKFAAESAYTIQEFGWLRDNYFYMTTIEGECGKSKKEPTIEHHCTGGLVVEAPGNMLPHDATIEEATAGSMQYVWMDKGDADTVSLPDGYWMQDRANGAMYATCSNDTFTGWTWKQDGAKGEWTCTKMPKPVPKSELPMCCISWDKESMFAYCQSNQNLKVQVTSKLNQKVHYFWLLAGLTGVPLVQGEESKSNWQWVALKEAVGLLVQD